MKNIQSTAINLSEAYDTNEVLEVLGKCGSDTNNIGFNTILAHAVECDSKKYVDKNRVIEYQEKNIIANIAPLLNRIETRIDNFDYNTEEVIEIEYMNVTVEVAVGIRISDNEKTVTLIPIDDDRGFADAYNKQYDELPKLTEALTRSLKPMIDRMNGDRPPDGWCRSEELARERYYAD